VEGEALRTERVQPAEDGAKLVLGGDADEEGRVVPLRQPAREVTEPFEREAVESTAHASAGRAPIEARPKSGRVHTRSRGAS
jgi:hypothetical protein